MISLGGFMLLLGLLFGGAALAMAGVISRGAFIVGLSAAVSGAWLYAMLWVGGSLPK